MVKGTPNKNAAAQLQQPKGKLHHTVSGKIQKKSAGGSGVVQQTHHSSSHLEVQNEVQTETGPIKAKTSKVDTTEIDVEPDEVKPRHTVLRATDSTSSTNHHDRHGDRGSRGAGRFIIKNLWDVCCNETESEVKELDMILKKLGLPSVNYSKTKAYDITDYDYAPDIQNCKSKDFLDFYVFPYLLPAIQALIQFARVNRVFQCRFCTFNALDYIVEYLYNNNPRYPERFNDPTPIFEIPFAKAWLEKHPRKPPPRWMLMSSEEAAIIIQRAIRGYMVRCRPDVQEMRQFWRAYRKDMEDEKAYYQYGKNLHKNLAASTIYSPYYEEYRGEFEESCESPCIPLPGQSGPSSPSVTHHSDHCVYCQAFRKFLDTQPEEILKSYQKPSADNLSVNGDQSGRLSSGGYDEMGGSTEALTTDTGAENEDNSGKEKGVRKESGQTAAQQHTQEGLLADTVSKMKVLNKLPVASIAHKSFMALTKNKQEKKGRKHD